MDTIFGRAGVPHRDIQGQIVSQFDCKVLSV